MARFMGLGRRVVGGGGARFRRPFKPTPAGSTSTTTRSTTRRCCCYSTSSVASSFRGIASGSGAILTSTGREERIPCLVGWNICSSSTTSTTCSSKRFLSSGSPQPHDVTDEEEEAPSGGGHVIICYGSQTGTAQMYADELHERAETHGRSSEVISMKSISGEELLKRAGKGAVIAFIIANFGKGQPPDNAKDMYNWFLAQQPGDVRSSFDWSRFRYTIFGLGNKQAYPENYQRVGRTLDEHLQALGAVCLTGRGEGDSSDDVDDEFGKWEEGLWDSAGTVLSHASSELSTETGIPIAKVSTGHKMDELALGARGPHFTKLGQSPPTCAGYTVDNPFHARVLLNECITPPSSRKVVHHLTLGGRGDDGQLGLNYETGDYLGCLPQNSLADGEAFARAMGWGQEMANCVPGWGDHELMDIVIKYCDISSRPRQQFLRKISQFVVEEDEREWIEAAAEKTDEGRALFAEKISSRFISTSELLTQALRSVRMSPLDFLDICPPLTSRYYSISSSSLLSPDAVELTVGLVQYPTPLGVIHEGMASKYLVRQALSGSTVLSHIKHSDFRLPHEADRPIYMVAAGSGIAPFRAFVQERAFLARQELRAVGPTKLYFGADAPQTNDLYFDELQAYAHEGLLDLHMTYSQDVNSQQLYPQDLVRRDAQNIISSIMQGGAHLYVCGHGQLGEGVRHTLRNEISSAMGIGAEEADAILQDWRTRGVFQEDIFS